MNSVNMFNAKLFDSYKALDLGSSSSWVRRNAASNGASNGEVDPQKSGWFWTGYCAADQLRDVRQPASFYCLKVSHGSRTKYLVSRTELTCFKTGCFETVLKQYHFPGVFF